MSTPCVFCGYEIDAERTGEPSLEFKGKTLCSNCYIDIIEPIYKMSGIGDGCIIHLIFKGCLLLGMNKKRRKAMCNYKIIFNQILHKYNFKCVHCGERDIKKLTIDHIEPISKGGTDELCNLQILCKSCNSKKGAK